MMKWTKMWFRKVSGATALILLISLMVPLLAYAQSYIFQASYVRTTGTVTASVYTDETVTGNVYLNLNDNNMSVIDSVYLSAPTGTYTVGNAVYDRYDFTYKLSSTIYDMLKLTSWYVDPNSNETVTSVVYSVYAPTTPGNGGGNNGGGNNGGGGSGGGSGGGNPSAPNPTPNPAPDNGAIDGKIQIGADGSISEQELATELAANTTVTIELPTSGLVKLPAAALKAAKPDRVLILNNKGITLDLPLKVLNFTELENLTKTKAEQMTINAKVAPLSDAERNAVEVKAQLIGAAVVSAPVEYSLTAVGSEGSSALIDDFGRTYVNRTIPVNTDADAGQLTGVVYNADQGTFSFVPATFTTDGNGKISSASLKRPSNSIYAVIKHMKIFDDIEGHWAKEDIDLMAGKLIVEGVSELRFEPNRDITRAEFAALLVRSLGLQTSTASNAQFNDIQNGMWYSEVVSAAVKAGLINGYPDGSFKPNRTITRAEMAVMISRALAFAGADTNITAENARAYVGKFTDSNKLPWATNDLAVAIRAGIITGMTDTTIAPRENATRAQAATMLKRMLEHNDFI